MSEEEARKQSTAAIWTEALIFSFPKAGKSALGPLDLHVAAGEAISLLGPNGAGKTTLVHLLCGLLEPNSGRARVLGLDPARERVALMRRIGIVMGGRTGLQPDLPLAATLSLISAAHGIPKSVAKNRAGELLERFGIPELSARAPATFSLGQRMRAEIAAALLHRPRLLVLDEPTVGLDAEAKDVLRAALAALLAEESATLLLTSHDTQDIVRLCPRVVLIDEGLCRYDGALSGFLARWGGRRMLSIRYAEEPAETPVLFLPEGCSMVSATGCDVRLSFDPKLRPASSVISEVLSQGREIADLSVSEPDLDEALRSAYADGAR